MLTINQNLLLLISDYGGAALSVTIVLLFARNNISSWFLSFFSYLNGFYLYTANGIYGKACLQIIYLLIAIYGSWHWFSGGKNNTRLEISNLPTKEASYLLIFLIIFYYSVFLILSRFTNSTIPSLDALTMGLCIIGHWLTSRKYIECWIFWFMTDILVASLFLYKNLPGHLMLNLVYLPIAVYGYCNWQKELKQSKLKLVAV